MYRDTHNIYFCRKHFEIPRSCRHLTFFAGEIDTDLFYKYDTETESFLQSRLRGTMVLKPITPGEVGRTILNPVELRIPECFICSTHFDCNILGHKFNVIGFLYSSQDTETMTCAEVTLWSILEYYGTRYPEYHTVLPSQILQALENISSERVLPSQGLEFSWMSSLFKSFGFSPRIYDYKAYSNDSHQILEFRRAFHCYTESGIPLAVGISGKKSGEESKHSVVVIGHCSRCKKLKASDVQYMGSTRVYPYLEASALYEDYVIMDDNQAPYQVQSYENLAGWDTSYVSTFAVPLPSNVFLEANDALAIANTIFVSDNLGFPFFIPYLAETIDQNNPLLLRVFMASSSDFLGSRSRNAKSNALTAFYASLRFPQYIWVAEISTYESNQRDEIYGEIIMDATASRNSGLKSLLLIRYLDHIGYRSLEDLTIRKIDEGLKYKTRNVSFPYARYQGCLMRCGRSE